MAHEGTIAIDGRSTGQLRRRALAQLVAYVPQLPELPPEMTASEYVLLGRTPHIGYLRMETRADREICAGLLDRMTLAPTAGRPLGTLSGGELQRVAAAGPPASVLRDEVLAGHFGPGLHVLRTAGGELVVTARRTGPAVRPPAPGR